MNNKKKIWNRRIKTKQYSFKKTKKLSTIVDKQIKNTKSFKSIADKFNLIWIPSVDSFLILLVLFAMITLLTNIWLNDKWSEFIHISILDDIHIPVISSGSVHYQNLISITSGIGAVLIGLAFFVAQSLMDKEDTDRAKVLLYKSKFFPLLSSEIFLFILLLLGDLNIFIYPVLGVFGFSVIFSLGRTIEIMINTSDLEKSRIKTFSDILKGTFVKIMNNEFRRRISLNNYFNIGSEFSEQYSGKVEFTPFGPMNKEEYVPFIAKNEGYLTDINLHEIDLLINEIVSKYTIPSSLSATFENENMSSKNIISEKKTPVIYFVIMPFSKIELGSKLLYVHKDVLEKNIVLKSSIERRIKLIHEIKAYKNYEEDAKYELSRLKQRCLKFIDAKNVDELSKTISTYNELVVELFNLLNSSFGGGFTREQAEKERLAFFGERLRPLDWISKDIRELFERAISTENLNIIRVVTYQPFSLAKLSIKHSDHLVYQNYISYSISIYSKGFELKEENENVSRFLIDRGWRYIKELTDFHLVYQFENNELTETEFVGFAFYIIKNFQNLMKHCFQNRDIDNFKTVTKKYNQLFEHFRLDFIAGEIEDEECLSHKLKKLKDESIFGLCSWIFAELRKTEDESCVPYYTLLKDVLPGNVEKITDIFISVHSYDVESKWGWGDWESNNHEEGVVYSIDFLSKLEALYAVMALEMLSLKSTEQIRNITLPISRELAFLVEGTRNLINYINKIGTRDHEFKAVITNEMVEKCDLLIELLEVAKNQQEAKERMIRINTPISSSKVNLFKDNVWKNTLDTNGVKKILEHYELIQNKYKLGIVKKEKRFGINTYFDRSVFLNDEVEPHVLFTQMDDGFDFGRSIIQGEDMSIINKVVEFSEEANEEDFEELLSSRLSISDTIIISTNHGAFNLFESKYEFDKYIPKWHRDFPKDRYKRLEEIIGGIFKYKNSEIPVFEIYNSNVQSEILILDVNKLGEYIQYLPAEISKDNNNICEYLSIEVNEMTSNVINQVMDDAPTWLLEKGNKESQQDYLNERVIIQVYESFEFNLDSNFEGIRIDVSK